jgi:hypothetical protein
MGHRVVNLEELCVKIEEANIVDHLIGLFTRCRNIKKFTLSTWIMDVTAVSRSLRSILPIFSELEELAIEQNSYHSNEDFNEVFDVIVSNCSSLRKLVVSKVHKQAAVNYFRNSNIKVFGC